MGKSRRFKEKTTVIIRAVFLVSRGVENKQFQQSVSAHSGAGEKETLNINFVGKTTHIHHSSWFDFPKGRWQGGWANIKNDLPLLVLVRYADSLRLPHHISDEPMTSAI